MGGWVTGIPHETDAIPPRQRGRGGTAAEPHVDALGAHRRLLGDASGQRECPLLVGGEVR